MSTPKIFNQLLICMNLYQHAKNQLDPSVHSYDTVNFRIQRPEWPPYPTKKFLSTSNFCEFVSICHEYNQLNSYTHSLDTADFRVL